MASLQQHSDGTWRIRFRVAGKQFFKSLGTKSDETANAALATVEETLGLLRRGRLVLPPGASADEVGRWVISGGTVSRRPTIPERMTVGAVIERYLTDLPGTVADSTLATAQIHCRHFVKVLGEGVSFREVGPEQLQEYVRSRTTGKEQVGATTVRKELATYGSIWRYAESRGWVTGRNPKRGVKPPLEETKLPFATWEQIEEAIVAGGGEDNWERLYFREAEVLALLKFVKEHASQPYIHPMVCAAAYTGMRRSELCASRKTDWDFKRMVLTVHERKRVRGVTGSVREVDIHPALAVVMRDWLGGHPGGPHAFLSDRGGASWREATAQLTKTLAGSKWAKLKGWHVLRHSFISICAAKGLSQAVIDRWAGHSTEQQRRRYRHLLPETTREAMGLLFSSPAPAATPQT